MPALPKIVKMKAFKNVRLDSQSKEEYKMENHENVVAKSGINAKFYDQSLLTDRNRLNIVNMLHKEKAMNEW